MKLFQLEQAPETNMPPSMQPVIVQHASPHKPHSFVLLFPRDRDYHLKTYKSVVPGSKLVDWLLAQVSLSSPRLCGLGLAM